MEKECYEEEVQPYRKTDYKPIIYISSANLTNLDEVVPLLMSDIIIKNNSGPMNVPWVTPLIKYSRAGTMNTFKNCLDNHWGDHPLRYHFLSTTPNECRE